MTIEDFKLKYETELGLRQNVESDINGLRPLLDQLTLTRSDLELEFETLKEELICLKKNHEEESKGLHVQISGDVSVEVNAAPGEDLTEILNDLRREYEQIIENNRREVEKWYETKIAEVHHEVHLSGQGIESGNKQVTELRREYQNLEIELQSHLSTSLQSSLADTEGRYNLQLQQLQNLIVSVEEELASIRCEIDNQNQEYRLLLGIKNQLEQEIAQYRHLLDEGNQDISVSREGGGISSGGRIIGGGGSGGRTGGSSLTYGSSTGGGRGGEKGGSFTGGGGSGGRTETRESSVHYAGGSTVRKGESYSGDGTGGSGGKSCGITGGGERISGGSSSSSHSYSSTHGHSSSQPSKSGEIYGKNLFPCSLHSNSNSRLIAHLAQRIPCVGNTAMFY
uniref:IF rod domain-containing protein n=2 Tax=Gopherus TaxID=38771 RepID=A0A8C4Y4G0_9SAUR